MRLHTQCLVLGFMFLAPGPSPAAPHAEDLLPQVEARLETLRKELETTSDLLRRARLQLWTGDPEAARNTLSSLDSMDPNVASLSFRARLALAEYPEARGEITRMVPAWIEDPQVRANAYRWWVMIDDLPRLEEASGRRTHSVDSGARAELALLTLDFEGAAARYQEALEAATTRADSARAYHGLGVVSYRQRDFEASLAQLAEAVLRSDPDPDLLLSLADTFIRLGKTSLAIDAAELAVEISPFHEAGHYLLGNGYTARNYSDLFAAFPGAFADRAGKDAMAAGDALLAAGDAAGAAAAYEAIAAAHPEWADVCVRQGSLAFSRGEFDRAMRYFALGLILCPEYGRAHNGMAKAVEAKRLLEEAHRSAYEARFASMPTPEVPGIEDFVLNWESLTPRHRKQVALSIYPWKRYLPVLIASGATYYIKPLYELLSESPGQELLRDQRINYDSRLWDDVRGCGGYRTVTGIEDVERTILNRYNTVLHELTHQVHSVLTADRKRDIQELYRRTKERDEDGNDAFLSRYAGGSVWEYFAEGANALESPRRDAYDTREIVLERLVAKDPPLRQIVQELMIQADVESCYAVGFTNRGDDRLERGLAGEAIAAYEQSLERAPGNEIALGALIFAMEVADSADRAVVLAERESRANPVSATLAVRHARTRWESGRPLAEAIAGLEAARPQVREADRYQVDIELGWLHWIAGNGEKAQEAYGRVLEYQADNPEGLWGLASALALSGNWDAAFARFEEAVRVRTGVVDLRADYARELLRAKRPESAREQIDAALLLDPEDPTILALDGWWLLEQDRVEEARTQAARALELGPWSDLARIVLARIEFKAGHADRANEAVEPLLRRIEGNLPPRYVYRSKWGRYDLVHTLPEVERRLIPSL